MVQLSDREIHRVRHLFDTEQLAFVVDAMIAGNTPASVWTDDAALPRTALIWDRAHSVYLAGEMARPTVWRELFDREILPTGGGFLKAYVTDEVAGTVFAGYPLQRGERVLYRGVAQAIPDWPKPAEFSISAINDQFAQLSVLDNFADVTAEIESCWKSMDDFRRSGFGFAAHNTDTIVSWCTAEYVSDRQCGIGIETVAAYGGRGFATLTASAFVEHCAGRGLTPYWDAWTDNLPSVAVAEKVGFRKAATYSIFVGNLESPHPEA